MSPLPPHIAGTGRSGVTLIELLIALVMLTLVIGIGGATVQRTLTVEHRATAVAARQSSLSNALHTLRLHAESADPGLGDIAAAADTALELVSAIAVTSVCRVRGDTLVTTVDNAGTPWTATLPRNVVVGDLVRIWDDSAAQWTSREVIAVAAPSGACGDSTAPSMGRAGQRLRVSDSLPRARVGAVMRVAQRERWSLVRGGDGLWSLSLATWDAARGVSGVPQPLVSGLATPTSVAAAGFRVRAIDASGAALGAADLARTRSLLVDLRDATHSRFPTVIDSVRINVGGR
jgi:type II secretory pathway pseudopilin PulG